jgi:hypothetical protein
MAGTEDYSFYYSLENSPFWIRKADSATSAENDGRIQHGENKAISPITSRYRYGKPLQLLISSHFFYGCAKFIFSFIQHQKI